MAEATARSGLQLASACYLERNLRGAPADQGVDRPQRRAALSDRRCLSAGRPAGCGRAAAELRPLAVAESTSSTARQATGCHEHAQAGGAPRCCRLVPPSGIIAGPGRGAYGMAAHDGA